MSQDDAWYVMLPDGDVHRVTLDQLDEAFQQGHVDSETLVLADGAEKWTRLGLLAGLDDAPAPPFEPGFRDTAPQAPRAPAPQIPTYMTAQSPASVPPGFYEPAMRVPVTNSFRPVSVDLSDVDLENVSFRGGSGRFAKRAASFLVALAAVGGIAFVATSRPYWARPVMSRADQVLARVGLHLPGAEAPAQATVAPVVPEPLPAPAPPPAAVVTPQPSTPSAAANTAAPAPSVQDTTLMYEPRQDPKPLKTKQKAHVHAHAVSHGAPRTKGTGFTTSGNKYDPLNSSINP